MKQSIWIAIVVLVGCVGCKNDPKDFHVYVECYYDNDYCIHFHQGGIPFVKSGNIMTTFDLDRLYDGNGIRYVDNWFEKNMWQGEDVTHQLYLGSKQQCIQLAQTFPCYDSVVSYNNRIQSQYEQLVKFRKAHPIKYIVQKKNCCTSTDNVQIK